MKIATLEAPTNNGMLWCGTATGGGYRWRFYIDQHGRVSGVQRRHRRLIFHEGQAFECWMLRVGTPVSLVTAARKAWREARRATAAPRVLQEAA